MVLFMVVCVAAALLPATASAHEPTIETYTYEVDVEKTRQVPVYTWVDEPIMATREVPVYRYFTGRVRVSPYWEKYTYRLPCETIIIGNEVGTYCPPPKTSWRQVYNYQRVTKRVQTGTRTETYDTGRTRRVQEQTGTRTETYTTTETRTGTRQVHDPHYEPTPTATPDPAPAPCPEGTKRHPATKGCYSAPTPTRESVICPTGYQAPPLPATTRRPGSDEEVKIATEEQIRQNPSMARYAIYWKRHADTAGCFGLVYPPAGTSSVDVAAAVRSFGSNLDTFIGEVLKAADKATIATPALREGVLYGSLIRDLVDYYRGEDIDQRTLDLPATLRALAVVGRGTMATTKVLARGMYSAVCNPEGTGTISGVSGGAVTAFLRGSAREIVRRISGPAGLATTLGSNRSITGACNRWPLEAAPASAPTATATATPAATPTATPVPESDDDKGGGDEQGPPPVFDNHRCRQISSTYRICHYRTPDGWVERHYDDS
ncbi:MAG: hypothetical protein KTV68_02670 [Acidimicrobiia bacterium]|nr:hypothetical protein [Acidimicrobiia bacterium]MCY4434245.1 hypothetical protein [bacterium]